MVLPSGQKTRVKSLVYYEEELEEAFNPMAITVTLEDEIDISRGDMFVHLHNLPLKSSIFEAMIIWMDEKPLETEKMYLIKHAVSTVQSEVSEIRFKVNVNTLQRESCENLRLNEIGRVVVKLTRPLLYDHYSRNKTTGNLRSMKFRSLEI